MYISRYGFPTTGKTMAEPRPTIPTAYDANIMQQVIGALAANLQIPPRDIGLETTFDSLDMDSLEEVEFVMELEFRLDIKIPDEDTYQLKSVRGTVEYLQTTYSQLLNRDQAK